MPFPATPSFTRSVRSALVVLAVLWSLAPSGGAFADYYDGIVAFDEGDYELALSQIRPEADRGNPDAQFRMGVLYENGFGIDQDLATAIDWYRKAADSDHPRAQNNLAVLYETGRGLDQDYEQALVLYQRAATQGRISAQYNLGRMIEEGLGRDPSDSEAAELYLQAAARGHAGAQARLGAMYEEGRGVTLDVYEATRWYRKAAKQGNSEAQNALGGMYEHGKGVTASRKQAAKWYERSASQGNTAGLSNYRRISGGASAPAAATTAAVASQPATAPAAPVSAPPDGSSAVATHGEATTLDPGLDPPLTDDEQNDPESAYRLGLAYATGQGQPENATLAEEWLQRSAEAGHQLAAYRLALLYVRGEGASGDKEFALAHAWFRLLGEQDYGDSATWRDRLAKKMSRDELETSERLYEGLANKR